jgi:hypothetical protein
MNSEEKQRLKEKFRSQLMKHVDQFNVAVSTEDGDWVVKGFIDIAKNIYTISVDTKVISKIMELLLFPKICQFADEYNYKLVLCEEQNHYPDITFIDANNNKFAVDVKSTYRITEEETENKKLLKAGIKIVGYKLNNAIRLNITRELERFCAIEAVSDDDLKNKEVFNQLTEKEKREALRIFKKLNKPVSKVNGMTLGAFTGYFRDRNSVKTIRFPYKDYLGHYVLGVIYSRSDGLLDERKVYQLCDLKKITSVVKDFTFFIHEKYQIASDNPGSGNTKNIGSAKKIDELINGKGLFANLGEELFDDYWMFYLNKDMAKAVELKESPYKNLKAYMQYKKIKEKE